MTPEATVNGFMVFGCCAMGDIPLGLFETRQTAEEFGRAKTEDDVLAAARRMGRDTSIVYGVDVMEFRDGWPVEQNSVKLFEEDAEAAP